MYRIITMTGVLLTVLGILAGVLTHFPSTGLLFGQIPAQTLHLYAAYGVAGIAALLLTLSWWQVPMRKAAITASLFLALVVGLQIVLGVHVLKQPGQNLLITLHFLTAVILLSLFFWLMLRSNQVIEKFSKPVGPVNFNRLGIFVLFLQIALGCLVSANQASMACAGFPLCNGQWWPQADYEGVLNILKGEGAPTFDIQVALNWLHRVGSLISFVLLNCLMLISTSPRLSTSLRRSGLWLSFLLFVEVGLGIVGYRFNMPLWIVSAHSVFAALLMLPLIAIGFYSRYGFLGETESATKAFSREGVSDLEAEGSVAVPEEAYAEPTPDSLFLRLKSQLTKTRFGLGGLFVGQKAITDEILEDIEANLLVADVGVDVTAKIINRLSQRLDKNQLADGTAITNALKEELLGILAPCSKPLHIPKQDTPFVILVVGVNGAGKTTTIGKLAKRLQMQGYSVMLAAGDTFRAAAVEQLQTWGERNNIQVIAQQTGADSASVIFDGIQSAQAKGVDVLIADTAGRLHTKSNLMEELKKVKRIMSKLDESAPHEVLLVVDAGTGQNALSQAKQFNASVELTGIALTKLDGTAKGGVIFALAKQTGIPIRFIGVGEGIDDLQDFDAQTFIDALFVTD